MASRPISVLLASEDRGLLRCLGKLLRICACDVCQVGSLQETPAALESVSPDFLILDSEPSLEDALEISRCESARRARGEVYTLLLTRSVEVDDLHKALEAGVDDFLMKPVVYCELLARLRVGARELELERRLGEQAVVDPLTGLPNRRALESRLNRQLASGAGESSLGLCVLMEIDFFQRIVQQFGERAGEAALRGIAARIRDLAGEGVFVASLGSGRFAMLMSENDGEGITAWDAQLRQGWADSEILVGECRLQFTASFGIAAIDADDSITAADILRRSTDALELAKASGGDYVVRYGEMNDQDEAWSSFAGPGKLFDRAVARDVMTPLPSVLRAGQPASEAGGLLRRSRLAALPVVDDGGKTIGIVSEDSVGEDVAARTSPSATVAQVMVREFTSLDENAEFAELIESCTQDSATPIVITYDGRPTGLVMSENLVLLGRKLSKEDLVATVPFSPASDYLVVPDLCPPETATSPR